jgi:transcriptional regulator with XRE-family HTH domain
MTKYVRGENMIKEYRIKRGFTQEELAEKLELSTRQIQRIEKNEKNTTIKTLSKIRKILDIPDEEMIQIFYEKKEKKDSILT